MDQEQPKTLIVIVAKAEKWFDLIFDIPAMNGMDCSAHNAQL
jgi:hypothetical protein